MAHYRWNADTWAALQDWRITEKYTHDTYLRLGPITFQHGCSTTVNCEKDASYDFGTPYGLYVCGHTHRPIPVTRARERKKKLPFWYANPGTGANWDRMHYMDRMDKGLWGRGAVLIHTPGISQRRTAYASKVWTAEMREHSWARE